MRLQDQHLVPGIEKMNILESEKLLFGRGELIDDLWSRPREGILRRHDELNQKYWATMQHLKYGLQLEFPFPSPLSLDQ